MSSGVVLERGMARYNRAGGQGLAGGFIGGWTLPMRGGGRTSRRDTEELGHWRSGGERAGEDAAKDVNNAPWIPRRT